MGSSACCIRFWILGVGVCVFLLGTGCRGTSRDGTAGIRADAGDDSTGTVGTGGGDTEQETSQTDTGSTPTDTDTENGDTSTVEGDGSYRLEPPDPCANQHWVDGCIEGETSSTCGGVCNVANGCSPPEDPSKSDLKMTFACPRFMLFSEEMTEAARDDAKASGWDHPEDPPFVYGVVGHDAHGGVGGLDEGLESTCCQCYQMLFETPEPGSPQPPDLPIPKPMIVQSFNTAAGGPMNFDIFMGAGGYGAFNGCYDDPAFGNTSSFGHFTYTGFPYQFPGSGGIKFINIDECKANGTATTASISSSACQNRIAQLCNQAQADSALTTKNTRQSCILSNHLDSLYHQNWKVRVKRVDCPVNLTRVTGCRLKNAGLSSPDPSIRTVGDADASFKSGYTTTTMQDCCKPTCGWKNWVQDKGLEVDGDWNSFYSCDIDSVPMTR